MTVTAVSLIQPAGYIPASWFDDTDLETWILEGTAKTTAITDATRRDEAIAAWAYYRAYDAKAQEKADLPQSKSIDGQASISYGADRSDTWKQKADSWLATFNEYVAGTEESIPSFLFATAPGRRGR